MNAEAYAWIFLNHLPELGPMRFHRLLSAARSAEAVLRMAPRELSEAAVVTEEIAAAWKAAWQEAGFRARVDREVERFLRGEYRILTELEADYPPALRELMDRPPVLYVKGRWPLSERLRLGVVGTRRPSPYGIRAAHQLAGALAAEDVSVISGLAVGIDRIAHEAALNAGGETAAALGHGFAHLYPMQNRQLFERMAAEGTLITEFPYDARPHAGHFPRRNRIISGLARGVVVVEAGRPSGALITARYAAEQGKDVFAVPGSIFQETSAGCHCLLKKGAKLVETIDDILEEYALFERADRSLAPIKKESAAEKMLDLEPYERRIIDLLSQGPVPVDQLQLSLEGPVGRLAAALLSLEIKGYVKNLPGQRYGAC